ncbi:MAG: phenylalanine--tRNA ligase subunit alpha [Chloroflexota bacterium]|jgi:phenylalanyl-tRNA synthetase alpha chain|nr:phenylalanine--tRNA ligase subunit alpha [Chloroflexota bacterium]
MSSMLEQLAQLKVKALAELAALATTDETRSWYGTVLGRKGELTALLSGMMQLPKEERPAVGKLANEIKAELEAALQERQAAIALEEMTQALSAEHVDVTLPGRRPQIGAYHPTTTALREIVDILVQMGFQVYDSREVESDDMNFGLLNFPPGHPAREMQDTFFTTNPDVILRTHTSPGQIRAMREYAPEPVRLIMPGKCYRNEDVTARSEMMFYQVEGLVVGRSITFSDLKGVLLNFANQMYGEGRKIRFRKSYFPFTEPSVEMDVDCILCGAKGCRMCKYSGWLEITGAGMVHPVVLRNGGYDPAEFSGFAFGMGIERQAILKRSIDDIRYFYDNDVRFLERIA